MGMQEKLMEEISERRKSNESCWERISDACDAALTPPPAEQPAEEISMSVMAVHPIQAEKRRRSSSKAGFAKFQAMKKQRESMCIDNSAEVQAAKRRRSSSKADFAKFQAMKKQRESMCVDDSAEVDAKLCKKMRSF